ncbi:unnamed protein product [Diplocarpon coronariae]
MGQPPFYESGQTISEDFETASIRSYTLMPPPSTGPPPHQAGGSPCASSLHLFRAPTAPTLTSLSEANPKARHYHSVASHRASRQAIQEQCKEKEPEHIKQTSEDPESVGDITAEEHRRRREAGEHGVLEREDKSWDLLLVQIHDWEGRDRSREKFTKGVETRKQGKSAERLGIGGLGKRRRRWC